MATTPQQGAGMQPTRYSQSKRKTSESKSSTTWSMPLTNGNLLRIGGGVAIIIVGFILLSLGISTSWDNPLSVSVAPVVLVIGYCVAIPWAILWYRKDPTNPS